MRRIAIATCTNLPEPDVDEGLLLEALAAAGVEAEMAAWDDATIDWAKFGLVVIRSTWNYIEHLEAFQAWAQQVGRISRLYNPAEIVRWNSHKSYLQKLEARGIPIVATAWIEQGAPTTLGAVMDQHGWSDVVVKPQVGAGSFLTERFGRDQAGSEAFFRRLVATRAAMVQPFMKAVEGYGERSLIWIDGAITHAIRKSPRLGTASESVSEALPIADDERALADTVLASWAASLLYGRVDLIRGDDGKPVVMELELVEPSLFLRQSPTALARLVRGIVERACSSA